MRPRRYTDLLGELPGITTNLLAARLKAMETGGLVTREPSNRPLQRPNGSVGRSAPSPVRH